MSIQGMPLLTPSRAQFALALVVLKSKPVGLTPEEYIQQIRLVVVNRTRKEPVHNHHYIDGTMFWKQAYEKAEAENSKLLDKIFDLEHSIERNQSPPLRSPLVAKRKSEVNITNKANIQTKRRKIESTAVEEDLLNEPREQLKLLSLDCHSILRAFYAVRKNVNDKKATVATLCQSVKAASQIGGLSLKSLCKTTPDRSCSRSSTSNIEGLAKVIPKLWTVLLKAVQRIEALDTKMYAKCAPEMIYFFQQLLCQIQQYSLDEADRQTKLRRKAKGKAHSSALPIEAYGYNNTNNFETTCSAISKTTCQMLAALDLKCNAHSSVFTGVMCTLLDHIGSSMSLLIFAESGTRFEKQNGILPPRGLLDVAHIDSTTALATSQLAAPYLVLVLQKAMNIADNLTDRQRRQLLGPDASTARPESLMANLKNRLQTTLLRGVYGDEDTTFEKALERSAEPDEQDLGLLLDSIKQAESQTEWFIGQIWEHLGWDILTSD